MIVAAWNSAATLRAAVASVLDQSEVPLECVVVDDGSTDGTAEILAALSADDPRVVPVTSPGNEGVSAARNRGLAVARGEWLAFLDADDRLVSGGLAAMLRAADEHDALAVVGQRISTDGERTWMPVLYDMPDIREPGVKSIAANPGLLYYAGPVGKLYHRSCADGLLFEGRVLGDQPWVLRALLRAGDRIVVVGDVVYEWHRPHPDRYVPTITAARERSALLGAEAVAAAGAAHAIVSAEIERSVEPAAARHRLEVAYFERLLRADLSAQLSAAVRRRRSRARGHVRRARHAHQRRPGRRCRGHGRRRPEPARTAPSRLVPRAIVGSGGLRSTPAAGPGDRSDRCREGKRPRAADGAPVRDPAARPDRPTGGRGAHDGVAGRRGRATSPWSAPRVIATHPRSLQWPGERAQADLAGARRGAAAGTLAAVLTAVASLTGLSAMTAVVPVGLVVAAIVTGSLVIRDRTRRLDERLAAMRVRLKELEGAVDEVAAIATFGTMDMPYPPALGGNWALGWDGAAILAREIAVARPQTVVELGTGASSLVIGQQLRRSGWGHLYTLDHDAAYAAATRGHVAASGLDDWVTVLDAPLEEQEVDGDRYRWYHLPDEVTALDRIDVLVVDGPPQGTDSNGMPRYPALPMLGPKLGPGSLAFVDDARRDGERRMLARWLEGRPEWVMRIVWTRHGTALLRHVGDPDSAGTAT